MIRKIAIGAIALGVPLGAIVTLTACGTANSPAVLRVAYGDDVPSVNPPTRLDIALFDLDQQTDERIDQFVDDCYDWGGDLFPDVKIGASICVDVDY